MRCMAQTMSLTDAAARRDARRLGARELLAFVGMALGMFLAVLNIQIVGSSFAEIRAGLAAGPEEVSWVLTSALIAEVIMIPLSGWLSRLFSTRGLFTMCSLGFAAGSVGCASAWDIESMIVFRSFQGFCGGAIAPMVFATIYASFPARYQNTLSAIVSLLGTSAVALGPSLGGWISESLSWHWLFLFNLPFGLGATLLVAVFYDFDSPDWSLARRIDLPGITLLAVFFMSLLVVLERGRREDWFESSMILTLTGVTATAGILLLWRELTAKHPFIDLRIFANRNFVIGATYVAVFGAGLFVPLYLLPLFLARVIGLNTMQIGTWLFVLGLSMMIAGFAMPTLVKYFRLRTIALAGFALLALGTWFQAHLGVETSFESLLLPQILRGVATQLCFLSMVRLALGRLPVEQIKDGTAMFQLTMRLGAAVAVAVANAFLVIRAEVHYHRLREWTGETYTQAGRLLGVFDHRLGPSLGSGLDTEIAGIRMVARMAAQEAQIQAFNEITTVFAICLALSLLGLPLIRGVRDYVPK